MLKIHNDSYKYKDVDAIGQGWQTCWTHVALEESIWGRRSPEQFQQRNITNIVQQVYRT
jgi:hypothetical protein